MLILSPFWLCVGSAMSVSVNIMPVFEQLGLLEELLSFSVWYNYATIYDSKLGVIGTVGWKEQKRV